MIRCNVCGQQISSPARGIARVVKSRIVFTCSVSCAHHAAQGHSWKWRARRSVDWFATTSRLAIETIQWLSEKKLVWFAILFFVVVMSTEMLRRAPKTTHSWNLFSQAVFQETMGGAENVLEDALNLPMQHAESVLVDPVVANARAREILENSLQVQEPSIWDLEALDVLAQHGEMQAVLRLQQIVQNHAGNVRRKAAVALARAGVSDGVDMLRAELRSVNPMTAVLAAIELGRLGDVRALPILKRFMDRSDTHMAACEAAVFLQFEPARIRLMQVMHQADRMGDRVRAALVLAQTGNREGKDVLHTAFEDGQFRFMAALGLATLGDTRAIPVLQLALEHIALRKEAAESLRRFGRINDYTFLVRDMESQHVPMKISAAIAVYILTAPTRGKGEAHG